MRQKSGHLELYAGTVRILSSLSQIEGRFFLYVFYADYECKKSEKNNGPRRNDEGQGLNDEGQGLYVPFIHILS